MKLGNRKVVLSGLAITAFATMTAFTQLTPGSTSATNFATMAYHPVSTIVLTATQSNKSSALGVGAGIAKVFTQDSGITTEDSIQDSEIEESTQNTVTEESTSPSTQEQASSQASALTEASSTTVTSQTMDSTESAETSAETSSQSITEQTSTQTSEISETSQEEQASEWDLKAVPKVENALNIRSTPDENGEIVGKLYKGSAADIIETADGWTKITSGKVTEGYVKSDYIATGKEAEEIAKRDGKIVATITTETIRVRSAASEDASVVDLAANGDQYTATGEENGWVIIEFEGQPAYVSAQYATVELQLGTAVTREEELAAEKAAEEAKQKAEANKKKSAVSASSDETMLLAALVQMEAGGESYEGKLAVANVVMNRVRSGGYPNSVSGVIYQSGQFPGAASGALASILANGPSSSCQKAASEALSGVDNIGNLKHFNSTRLISPDSFASSIVIGNQCFY